MKKRKLDTSNEAYVNGLSRTLAELTRHLVDMPDLVSVESVPEPTGTGFVLHVDPADLGRIIGRSGRTVQALRVILNVASTKHNHRFTLELADGKEVGHEQPSTRKGPGTVPGAVPVTPKHSGAPSRK